MTRSRANRWTRPTLATLLAAGSLLSYSAFTGPSAHGAATDLTPVWQTGQNGVPAFGGQVVESSPLPVDLNGGGMDLVVGGMDSQIHGLDGSTGRTVPGWPFSVNAPVNSSPSAADTNGDGSTEIFVGSGVGNQQECSGGAMYSITTGGQQRWKFNATDPDCGSEAIQSSPALGDINHDNVADVNFGGLGLHAWSLTESGVVNTNWPFYADDTQFATPALADVDNDGQTDYIFGGDSTPGGPVDIRGGLVRAVDGTKGKDGEKWRFVEDEIVRSSPSVADLDGDGKVETVVGSGNQTSRAANGGSNDASKIFVLNNDGSVRWSRDTGAQTMASPTLADVNGDGSLDIIEGTWEVPQSPTRADQNAGGRVWAWDRNGNVLPGYPVDSGGGIVLGQISTVDFNGDGKQDLLIPTGNGVFIRNGANPSQLLGTLLKDQGIGFQNTPTVTDVDGDGHPDIFVAGFRTDGTGVAARYELGGAATFGARNWPMFHYNAARTGSLTNPPLRQTYCVPGDPTGYRMVASDGGVFSYCGAQFSGSMGGQPLNQPIVGSASVPNNSAAYWEVARDGGIFAFGGAVFHGSMGGRPLNQPIVGMAARPNGDGYWLVASDGGIFAFGGAQFYGSTGGQPLNQPIVGIAATKTGLGYWLVGRDGGIFAYGDAQFYGSTGGQKLNQPIVGIAASASSNGYWLVASDGGIFAYQAPFFGSTGSIKLNQPIVGMVANVHTGGYWMVARDGGIFAFNSPFLGSTGSTKLNQPIVAIGSV